MFTREIDDEPGGMMRNKYEINNISDEFKNRLNFHE